MTRKQLLEGATRLFVARPILALVLNLLIVIAGLSALMGVEVREMPDVDQPSLSVITTYEGAAAAVVDREVTMVLEDAFGALDGLKNISSNSSYGRSRITVDLNNNVDIDISANEIREIVSQTIEQLPADIEDPTVKKNDSDADPIIQLALTGSQSMAELTMLAEGRIKDRLSLIAGIAEITITGGQADEFRITYSMPALLARGLTLGDVSKTLQTLRNDYALGSLDTETNSTILRSVSPEVSSDLIGNLRINDTTRISDIAHIQLTGEEKTAFARANGKSSISIDIVRHSVGNTLSISQAVNIAVDQINAQLPDGADLAIMTDDGVYIEGSIKEVTKSIVMAICIVIMVIFIFLRSWRATLIPALAIPVALIGTVGAIWLVGFSINTISLLALVLATGMVVDDAIVVVENIVRRRQEGEGARVAAVAGSNEVFFAVVSTTATLAAVFIPISFLPGQAGGVFVEFGFVLAFCVAISSIVALTMAPMLASILDPGRNGNEQDAQGNKSLLRRKDSRITRLFLKVIDQSIRLPLITVGLALAFAVFAMGTTQTLTRTLTPPEDRSMFRIMAMGPVGANNDYMSDQVSQIEEILESYRESGEVVSTLSLIGRRGGTRAFVITRLADWADRERVQAAIGDELNAKLAHVPGLRVRARTPNSLGIRGNGLGLEFAVTGKDYPTLVAAADAMLAAMEEDPTFSNPQLDDDDAEVQISVDIDRDRALELGITPDEIAGSIAASTKGVTATSVFIKGEEVDLLLKPGGRQINDASDLERVFARTSEGSIIPLSSVATFSRELAQSFYAREGGQLAIAIEANLPEGINLGDAVNRTMNLATEVLPDDVSITLLGGASELKAGVSGTIIVFAIAGLIVLLVLAAQFESFTSAIIIMITVPFGLTAAMMAITITGGTLNYYSQIGLVMLIGVMAKNGILIVEFANQLRGRGLDIDSAIRDAVRLRLRPVMMTMVSTILGGLPLILTSGAGAEARMAVGWVVVAGLGLATLFTLFLIPALYRWIAPLGGDPGVASRKLGQEIAP